MIIRQGIDSKALLVTLVFALPQLLLLTAAGAVLGSGIYLSAALYASRETEYVSKTEYYIDFADGRLEAKDYYNDYTWNDVIATDLILGRMMDGLGDGYERDEVKEMLYADILSDVRYLTITVTGDDAERVAIVSEAFEQAVAEFAGSMDEFDAIYKIKDNGVGQEQKSLFTWRAALLGAVVFAAAGLFWTALAFLAGSRFYTKTDVMKYLETEAAGLSYRDKGAEADLQERRLIELLERLLKECERLYLLDAADGRDAGAFLERLRAVKAGLDFERLAVYKEDKDACVFAVVPFGRVYREKITDEINYAVSRGGTFAGAALTQCGRRWVRLYYGRKDVRT